MSVSQLQLFFSAIVYKYVDSCCTMKLYAIQLSDDTDTDIRVYVLSESWNHTKDLTANSRKVQNIPTSAVLKFTWIRFQRHMIKLATF